MGGCVSRRTQNPKKHNKKGRFWKHKEGTKFNTHFPGLAVTDTYDAPAFHLGHKVDSFDASKYICIDGDALMEIRRKATKRGSKEDAWFDAETRFDSESEEDFVSVHGDFVSSAGNTLSLPQSHTGTPRPSLAVLKERLQKIEATDSTFNPKESLESQERVSMDCGRTNDGQRQRRTLHFLFAETALEAHQQKDSTLTDFPDVTNARQNLSDTFHRTSAVTPVLDDGLGSIENEKCDQLYYKKFCLPCLTNSTISYEKRRFVSPCPISQRKRTPRRSLLMGHPSLDANGVLNSHEEVSKVFIKMPQAGIQVPYSSDESMERCWSTLSPSTFKLRGPNYTRDKKKQYAPPKGIYDVVGVDVFLASKKVNHIAQFVDLSFQDLPCGGDLPPLLIFNIQVPLHSASIFSGNSDGEGLSIVVYSKLSEAFKEAPLHLKEMLKKIVDDDKDRVRGLTGESITPFRERLKIIARVCNPEEMHLSAPERKLVTTYNEKPVLSRPQHVFYRGRNYFEIDLDVHRFSFLARKAAESFRERAKLCIVDIGLTIQGNKPEELPEHMLCCFRLKKLDIGGFKYLSI